MEQDEIHKLQGLIHTMFTAMFDKRKTPLMGLIRFVILFFTFFESEEKTAIEASKFKCEQDFNFASSNLKKCEGENLRNICDALLNAKYSNIKSVLLLFNGSKVDHTNTNKYRVGQ